MPATLPSVIITGKAPVAGSVAGWSDVPLAETPLQATTIDAAQIRDAGAQRLSDFVRFDASVSEAYDTEGYIDYFTVRGFVIDNRFNFRRDGLPINAETSIPLENKARVDVLKGLSGMQAGTSAPGGLVDLIVKRPLEAPLRSALLEWRERGSVTGAVDLSQRFGRYAAFGLRLNAAAARIDPEVRNARGDRNLLALAADWRAAPTTLLEAEVETSHRSQPSVPAFSLLGDRVPAVPDPRLSLNNQPWSLPVVFDATTASLRVTQKLSDDWRVVAHGLTQRLRTDDRVAFPFGCTVSNPAPGGIDYYPDRFCPNGDFDYDDFRSDNERRRSDSLDVSLHGKAATGPLRHSFVGGVLRTVVRNRFQDQTNYYPGHGNVDGSVMTVTGVGEPSANTDRDERSTELYLRDAIALTRDTTAWLGARHTQLARSSAPTDGSPGTAYRQSLTTPFAALSHAYAPGQLVYASWGRGVESEVVSNKLLVVGTGSSALTVPRYTNAGQALPAAKSRQVELGLKGGSENLEWNVAAFDIDQPKFGGVGECSGMPCAGGLTGRQRHRGVEANGGWRSGPWDLRAGLQWLRARVRTPDEPTTDDKRPTNVPALSARLQGGYSVASIPGLNVQAAAIYESAREVLPDNSIQIPGYARVDLGMRWQRRVGANAWTLRLGVDNLFDRRAWRESPYQYDHAYLFPMQSRTVRASLQVDL